MKPRIEGREDTKAGEVSFKPLHPTESATSTPSIGDKKLPDWRGIDGDEKRWRRCKQCGFILNKDKTSPGSGRGNNTPVFNPEGITSNTEYNTPIVYDSLTTTYDGINSAKVNDVVTRGGCPFCGASNF